MAAEKRNTQAFWSAVTVPDGTALHAGVAKLWLGGRVKVNLKESVPQVGAPQAWHAAACA